MSVRVSSRFDGGSIEVVGRDGNEVLLALPEDPGGFRHAFAFRARGSGRHSFRIVGASASSYPGGWDGYRVCCSEDGRRWFRVPTAYDGEVLAFGHRPREASALYATFAIYGKDRRARLVERVARSRHGRVLPLGGSLRGRPITALVLGDGEARVWVIARQHPGETMGEWLAEGLVESLLGRGRAASMLRSEATVMVVPCMNPDGASAGYHRTNALGVDLNRSWEEAEDAGAPEVSAVREAMEEMGVDVFLDVHGDETEDYCFVARSEGNPRYSGAIAAREEAFVAALLRASSDFQDDVRGYAPDPPGEADQSTAAGWVGARFACGAMTLEMPFKDARGAPSARDGWSPGRSRKLGRAVVPALRAALGASR